MTRGRNYGNTTRRRPAFFAGRAHRRCEELRLLPYSGETMPSKKHVVRKSDSRSQAKKRSGSANRVKVLSSKTVFQGPAFSVISDRVREPSGIVARRDVVRHSGSAVILAVDESGPEPRVLLERQFRYAAKDYLWELPAGRVDPGENALAGAKRELLEETGYRAAQWKQALFFYPSPGFLDETMTVYLARGLKTGAAQPEEDESIECHLVPLSKALQMVRSGEICDGKTISAVLWLAESLRG
jgi:ADP-ribose pyrophosphatase